MAERNEEFASKVFDDVLVAVERERDDMEREMTSRVVQFNIGVRQKAQEFDATVKSELHALREELERERAERQAYDQSLLDSVSHFLTNL